MKLLQGLLGLGLLAWSAHALEMELVRRPPWIRTTMRSEYGH
jgi:hypothetical protein